MNAILSVSLALGRTIAARDGKELWQLIREMAVVAMAGFVMACRPDGPVGYESLCAMDFEELKSLFRETAQIPIGEGKEIYRLLRKELPIYDTVLPLSRTLGFTPV
jgi:hypothetical protein